MASVGLGYMLQPMWRNVVLALVLELTNKSISVSSTKLGSSNKICQIGLLYLIKLIDADSPILQTDD